MAAHGAVAVAVAVFAFVTCVEARAVNISNTWVLPEDGFPVFYRYFRDRINWFEADAVCQFHHANLVTVDTGAQFDAARAFLKELDVLSPVWVGLKRGRDQPHFVWTSEQPLSSVGYWNEPLPTSSEELCAAADPAADFRWHGLSCGGLEVASFICELPVPDWAAARDGCMVENLPSLTAAFLPEEAAVELTSDCGLGGTRRVVCKGNTTREALYGQLNCHGMMNEDATLGPGLPPGNGQDNAEEQDQPEQPEQPEAEGDDAYTSTSTETSGSTEQASTRLRRATTSSTSTAKETTTDVSVDTSVPASSTEPSSEPSTVLESVTASPSTANRAAAASTAQAAAPSSTPRSDGEQRHPERPDTLIMAHKGEAATAATTTTEQPKEGMTKEVPTPVHEDKAIIVPVVAKKGPNFPKKVPIPVNSKPFRPEKPVIKLAHEAPVPVRPKPSTPGASAHATVQATEIPRFEASDKAEKASKAVTSKSTVTVGVSVPARTGSTAKKAAAKTTTQWKSVTMPITRFLAARPAQPAQPEVPEVPKAPVVTAEADNALDSNEYSGHMAGNAADDLDDALMIRELSSARTPLIKSVPVVDVPLPEPQAAQTTAAPASRLVKETAIFLSLPMSDRALRPPPSKKDGLPAAIAGAAVTTTSTTTTTTTTPAPAASAATTATSGGPTTTTDPTASTTPLVRLRESMAGPGGKARTLTTPPPAPESSAVSTADMSSTAAPVSTSSTAAPSTTSTPPPPTTTVAAVTQSAAPSSTTHHHVMNATTTTATSTAPRSENGEGAPRENGRRRQHLPAPLLSMNMKPESEDGEEGLESEPQSPPRPNRSRSLVRQQHHSFYPYFLNRVLG